MKGTTKARRSSATLGMLLATALLSACGGGDTAGAQAAPGAAEASTETRTMAALGRMSDQRAVTSAAALPQPAGTEGRLLASNCFQCHGTMGSGGFENIRGQEAGEVVEYLRKSASRDIMAAHAQGYTPAQLQKIIAYLQQ